MVIMELLQICNQKSSRKVNLGAYKKEPEGALAEVSNETAAVSVIDCIIQCVSVLEDNCYSFDFDKRTRVCKMSQLPAVENNGTSSCSSSVYSDIDECQEDNEVCGEALCVNTRGSFFCHCGNLSLTSMVELVQTFRSDVTASISSQYYGDYEYGPHIAVDGNKGISWDNLAVSLIEHSPWIQLDFTIAHCIHSVKIYDQAMNDESDDYLANVRVTIGETESDLTEEGDNYLCAYNEGQPPGDEFTMNCTRRLYGRFVRVTAVSIGTRLIMRELEVFGW
ncbi:uncharacterized protein [Watersipora subatra]|uniref:uncharacterized protein n=1 Tax=Watersipora subatra TaxID=2589382 RepID=UPI00355B1F7B